VSDQTETRLILLAVLVVVAAVGIALAAGWDPGSDDYDCPNGYVYDVVVEPATQGETFGCVPE
jgi:hypothetical protein